MSPNDPYQAGPLPQPQTPQPQQPAVPQPNAAGQYDVVPPPLPGMAGGVNGGHNPYEFIMSSNQHAKHRVALFGSGQSSAMRLLLLVAGVGLIVLVLGIIITALIPSNIPSDNLKILAQRQQELVRIATLGEREAASETTKGFAYNVDLSIGSAQRKVTNFLSAHGTKLSAKELALREDTATDATLASAKATSTYDTALKQALTDQLQSYQKDLQTAFDKTANAELKKLLNALNTDAAALVSQAQNASN